MTHKFKIQGTEYIAAQISPRDYNFYIDMGRNNFADLMYSFPTDNMWPGSGSVWLPFSIRDKYSLEIIGQVSKMSEHDCKKIIPRSEFEEHKTGPVFYRNHLQPLDPAYVFVLAKRSLWSLLEKNGASSGKDYVLIKKLNN